MVSAVSVAALLLSAALNSAVEFDWTALASTSKTTAPPSPPATPDFASTVTRWASVRSKLTAAPTTLVSAGKTMISAPKETSRI